MNVCITGRYRLSICGMILNQTCHADKQYVSGSVNPEGHKRQCLKTISDKKDKLKFLFKKLRKILNN